VYNNGTATDYTAGSWQASQVTVNTSTQQLLMNAKGSGGERVGGAWQWLGAGGAASQLFGAWEIDYYTQNGAGYWPVLLMWCPTDGNNWPIDGEIDIFEWYNAQPPVATHIGGSTNLHLATTAGLGNHLGLPNTYSHSSAANISAGNYQIDLSQGPNANGTHTVRLEWQNTYVAVYVDGVLVCSCSDMAWIPNTLPMVLTLQQEFYGTTDSSVPSLNANTVVTGLRAYKYTGAAFNGAPMSNLSDSFAVNDLSTLWYNTDPPVTWTAGSVSIPSNTSYYLAE
jgi:beta-glucanase (GH16 family)